MQEQINARYQQLNSDHLTGFLWLLLGLQRCGSIGGATEEDHRCPGVPQSAESGGLFKSDGEPRLPRRLHEQSLQVHHPERRH